MPVSALDRFRNLVHTHNQDPVGNEKLTHAELQSALSDLQPEDKLEAREIALDAMLSVELSDGALEELQTLLGIEQGVPSDTPLTSVPENSTFASRLKEAQGEHSVGGTTIWKYEVEQALKTLGADPAAEGVKEAVREMLATYDLTPSSVAAARLFIEEGRIESNETLRWPTNGAPADFEALTHVVGETVESAYDLTRINPNDDLAWTGPPTPDFALAGSPPIPERLTAESLLSNFENQGRDPLDVIMGIGIQLGMEQGRRAVRSGPGFQHAELQMSIMESAFQSGNNDLALQSINTLISGLMNPMFGGATASMMQPDGTMAWPEDDLPVSLDELAGPLRDLLENAYDMERINPHEDIQWFGPSVPSFMPIMPYDERLTAENLRTEEQDHGRDPLDVMVAMTLQLGMEQGRRMTVYQDMSGILPIAQMVQQALATGDTNTAHFMIPMLRQMWEL